MNSRIPFERSLNVRSLTEEEHVNLNKQNSRMVTPFLAEQLEGNARKHWDQFYNRNANRFFKDRHWTTSEFKELLGDNSNSENQKSLLEVGCGVGNLLFPLVEEKAFHKLFACDFSKRAVTLVQEHPLYDPDRMCAFHADLTTTNLIEALNGHLVDIVTMVFVLSAIHPSKFCKSAKNVYDCLKPGGIVLFRDYAVNDMTQVRFKPGHKIDDNFYMRQDGTRTYFLTVEKLQEVFLAAGFLEEDCCYIHSRTVNKKEGVNVPRTFLQAKFIKPR